MFEPKSWAGMSMSDLKRLAYRHALDGQALTEQEFHGCVAADVAPGTLGSPQDPWVVGWRIYEEMTRSHTPRALFWLWTLDREADGWRTIGYTEGRMLIASTGCLAVATCGVRMSALEAALKGERVDPAAIFAAPVIFAREYRDMRPILPGWTPPSVRLPDP